MKKKLLLLFMLFAPFIVNAKEVFELDWTTEYIEDSIIPYYGPNITFGKGYILSEHNLETYTTTLNYYSSSGKILIKKEINMLIWNAGEYFESLYALGIKEENNSELYLLKLNNDLEIEKELLVSDDTFMYAIEMEMLSQHTITKDGEKLLFLGRDKIVSVDKNLEELSIIELTEEKYKKNFRNIYDFYYEDSTENYIYSIHISDELNTISGGGLEECTESECKYKGALRLKENDKTIWRKTYSDYETIEDIIVLNEYIVAIAMTCKTECTDSILIIDKENGEVLQTINSNNNYQRLKGKEYSFSTISSDDFCFSTYESGSECGKSHFEIYYIPLKINKITDGNGSIDALNTSRYDEEITFSVTPKDGYKLDKIKVTDSNGNVVTFTNYTFTMPNNDVTIEATFIKKEKNPETSDALIYVLIITAIISGALLISNQKKYKWIK